ncbi:LOW QUALITY PROTEIN: alpha-N-acetylneuraminate alpha-2,8-sialyltransferase ST8SIA3-like [Discoglossus pictus]
MIDGNVGSITLFFDASRKHIYRNLEGTLTKGEDTCVGRNDAAMVKGIGARDSEKHQMVGKAATPELWNLRWHCFDAHAQTDESVPENSAPDICAELSSPPIPHPALPSVALAPYASLLSSPLYPMPSLDPELVFGKYCKVSQTGATRYEINYAFSRSRREILQNVDVIRIFSLTKNSVRTGQLMHYGYSSHKYVFSISNNFRSLLPDTSPIMNKHYNICAVVGNSGILTESQCGPEIDKSDFVFRCIFAPTEAFQKDVGKKTNLTTFNPSIIEEYYNNLLTIQDQNFLLNLTFLALDVAILWIPAFFFHTSNTVTRKLVDFFVEHREKLKVQLAWPGNIMQHVNR